MFGVFFLFLGWYGLSFVLSWLGVDNFVSYRTQETKEGLPSPPLIFLKIFGKGTGGPVRDAVGGGDGMFQAKTAVGLQGEL